MQTEQTRHLIATSKGGQGVCPNKKKALNPLKCSCASDTTRDENWWQNLRIRVSMWIKGFTSSSRGDDVHSHATSCLHCNWDPCSPWSVPMPTTTDPYCLLLIWITVMTSTPSYQFPSLCTALSQASRPIPAAAVPGFELKVPLCRSPRTGLPNTSLPIYACEIRNLSRLHKFGKGRRLLCPWPTSVAWDPLAYPHHPRWNHSLG